MLAARCPQLAEEVCTQLEGGSSRAQSLREAAEARRTLERAGYRDCPTWMGVRHEQRPPRPEEVEPGEYTHGWQYFASSKLDTRHREEVMSCKLGHSRQALLRSQSGCGAGAHLTALPLHKETKWAAAELRVLLLRRLRLPLQLGPRHCRCGQQLDLFGDHRAACSNAGVLQTRAKPLEQMW